MRTLVPECNLIEDREELLPADVQPRRVADASCYQDNNGERLTLLFLVACANYYALFEEPKNVFAIGCIYGKQPLVSGLSKFWRRRRRSFT